MPGCYQGKLTLFGPATSRSPTPHPRHSLRILRPVITAPVRATSTAPVAGAWPSRRGGRFAEVNHLQKFKDTNLRAIRCPLNIFLRHLDPGWCKLTLEVLGGNLAASRAFYEELPGAGALHGA